MKTSKYYGVSRYAPKTGTGIKQNSSRFKWQAGFTLNGRVKSKIFINEKDAAKYVDMQLILAGKEPVNILTRK